MLQTISDEDFRKLTNFIKAEYGITLQEKRQLVTSRLSTLVTEQGFHDFSPFVAQLLRERNPQNGTGTKPSDHQLHVLHA